MSRHAVCWSANRPFSERRLFNRVGLLGLGQRLPARIVGVEQHAGPEDDVPACCPKCGNAHLVTASRLTVDGPGSVLLSNANVLANIRAIGEAIGGGGAIPCGS